MPSRGRWRLNTRTATILAAAAGFLCLACYGPTKPAGERRPVTLRVAAALPTGSAVAGFNVLVNLLYSEPLLAIDWNGRPQPRLAESWKAERGAIRVTLRPNVKLHDGRPLTAELVRNVLRREVKKPINQGADNIVSVDAEGQDLIIRVRELDAFVIEDLSQYFVVSPDNNDIGTGPFKFISRGGQPQLEAFPAYYRGAPTIQRVEFQKYSSQRAAWAAMMRGDADMLHEVSPDSVEFVEETSELRAYATVRPYYITMVFNVRHPELARPEVRQALNEAIDRQALLRLAMQGRGQPAEGPIWPYHWAYTSSPHVVQYNPVAARLRLEVAGMSALRQARPDVMPSRLAFKCMYYAGDARFERIAMVVQKQLSEIGVDVDMQPVDLAEFANRASSGDFDAFLFELNSGRSLSWVYRFWHSPVKGTSPYFKTGYTAADRALDRARLAMSEDQMREAVAEVQQAFFDDPPAIFLVWPQVTRAVDRKFDISQSGGGDVIGTIWQWRYASAAGIAQR